MSSVVVQSFRDLMLNEETDELQQQQQHLSDNSHCRSSQQLATAATCLAKPQPAHSNTVIR